jgi:hypothetical protein
MKLKNVAITRTAKPKTDEELALEKEQEAKLAAEKAQEEKLKEEAAAEAKKAAAAKYEAELAESARLDQEFATMKKETPATVATPARRLNLRPEDGILARTTLLRIWRAHNKEKHHSVASLCTGPRPGESKTPADPRAGFGINRANDSGRGGRGNRESDRRGNNKGGVKEQGLKPGVGAYRMGGTEKNREEEIKRDVNALLNKICPENLKTIVERLATIELNNRPELEGVIKIIFQKALKEQHYVATYADMVFALKSRYPDFPGEAEGEKPITFTRVLLNTCQNEFENLPTSFEATAEEIATYPEDDLRLMMKFRKDKMLANMKFIGNLFLRQLLAVKVIGQVVHDLVGIRETTAGMTVLPEEHMIECVCELLQAIGYTLDATTHGKMLMQQFSHRLTDLKSSKTPDNKIKYPKRVQYLIQDLLDLRGNNWHKKLFKEQAKTKDEIKKDAVKDARAKDPNHFTTAVAGVRPAYIMDDLPKKQPIKKAEGPTKQEWTQTWVKRCFHNYSDDLNGKGLQDDWLKPGPTVQESKQGVEWLSEIGFSDYRKEDLVAQAVVELLTRQVITWNILVDVVGPSLEVLEDRKIDEPQADVFFHSLLARLLMAATRDFPFNAIFFKRLPPKGDSNFSWSLLVGALRTVKRKGGQEAYRKALDAPELISTLAKSKACEPSNVKRLLQDEIH